MSVPSYTAQYALSESRAAGICLLDLGPDAVVADFGAGWGNITRVLSRFCGHVFSVDMTPESLEFAVLLSDHSNVTYVRGGEGARFPFREAALDAVVLNGVLEWLPENSDLSEDPREVQLRFLREVRKALRPGGQVYVGIENRYGALYWLGQREDHTGLRFGAVLPRPVSNIYSLLVRKRPYRTYTYSYSAYLRLLEEAGFDLCEVHHPWPDYREIARLPPRRTLKRCVSESLASRHSIKWRLAGWAYQTVSWLPFTHLLTPSFIVLGRRNGGKANQPKNRNLLGHVLTANGERFEDVVDIVVSEIGAWHVTTERHVYKIPFTPCAADGLHADLLNQDYVRSHFPPLGVMTLASRLLDVEGASAFVAPRGESRHPRQSVDQFVSDYLRAADALATEAALDLREIGARLRGYLGAESTERLDYLLDALAQMAWRIGPTHGDLRRGNVVDAGDGRLALIGWDRFRPHGPVLVDRLHFCVADALCATGMEAEDYLVQMLRDGPVRPPYVPGLEGTAVNVTTAEWVLYTLTVLAHRVATVPHPVYLPRRFGDLVDTALSVSLHDGTVRLPVSKGL